MNYYEYRHRVGLEETNVVGNVYFTHYLRWQGRCREMFLHAHAPQLMAELGQGFTLATTRAACSYYRELAPLDDVAVRMRASAITPSRLTMVFQYVRIGADGAEELAAEGEQEIACMRRVDGRMQPAALPEALREAAAIYMGSPAPALAGSSRVG